MGCIVCPGVRRKRGNPRPPDAINPLMQGAEKQRRRESTHPAAANLHARGNTMKEIYLLTVMAAVFLMLAMLLLLPGCSQEPAARNTAAPAATQPMPVTAPHGLDPVRMARGEKLYRQHCATCHGARAEGAPNWQRPGPDGKYPAPPLDGSGHAWHHPGTALKQTIRGGTLKLGGGMPAWKDKLSDTDIEAVIAWFQSTWPDEIYSAWMNMEMRTNK